MKMLVAALLPICFLLTMDLDFTGAVRLVRQAGKQASKFTRRDADDYQLNDIYPERRRRDASQNMGGYEFKRNSRGDDMMEDYQRLEEEPFEFKREIDGRRSVQEQARFKRSENDNRNGMEGLDSSMYRFKRNRNNDRIFDEEASEGLNFKRQSINQDALQSVMGDYRFKRGSFGEEDDRNEELAFKRGSDALTQTEDIDDYQGLNSRFKRRSGIDELDPFYQFESAGDDKDFIFKNGIENDVDLDESENLDFKRNAFDDRERQEMEEDRKMFQFKDGAIEELTDGNAGDSFNYGDGVSDTGSNGNYQGRFKRSNDAQKTEDGTYEYLVKRNSFGEEEVQDLGFKRGNFEAESYRGDGARNYRVQRGTGYDFNNEEA